MYLLPASLWWFCHCLKPRVVLSFCVMFRTVKSLSVRSRVVLSFVLEVQGGSVVCLHFFFPKSRVVLSFCLKSRVVLSFCSRSRRVLSACVKSAFFFFFFFKVQSDSVILFEVQDGSVILFKIQDGSLSLCEVCFPPPSPFPPSPPPQSSGWFCHSVRDPGWLSQPVWTLLFFLFFFFFFQSPGWFCHFVWSPGWFCHSVWDPGWFSQPVWSSQSREVCSLCLKSG